MATIRSLISYFRSSGNDGDCLTYGYCSCLLWCPVVIMVACICTVKIRDRRRSLLATKGNSGNKPFGHLHDGHDEARD